MKLHIRPLVALVDEKIDICVSEVPPFSKVKVSASLRFPWAKSVLYESAAWFTADGNVRTCPFDQDKDSPVVGGVFL